MLKVSKVIRNSIAADLGIQVGDRITAFDGYPAVDELDYFFYNAKEKFTLAVEDDTQKAVLTVEKDEEEDLGLEFEPQDEIHTCHNHCVFCFVDQMPKGMRESLYVKDDDYGMSFQCGNFVTLTNLPDEELDRIIRLQLSPLYVSVQTMNPDLRCKLLGNRFAGKITEQIKKLAQGGIRLHCQAVIVPHVSDGKELEYTARQLFQYYPNVCDLAVVPTGITKYREGLTPIADIDKESSEQLLDLVDSLNQEFGVNFILPADEYFIRSGRPFKDREFYGDFEQIENGIGMTTKFLSEFSDAMSGNKKKKLRQEKRVICICGTSAKGVMEQVCAEANEKIEGLQARPLSIVNDFFGPTVTCTGLLTGEDILKALLKESGTYDQVILPCNTLREFTEDFLDGMTIAELKEKSGAKNIAVNRGGGFGLVELFCKEEREKSNKQTSNPNKGKRVLYERKYKK
jgi:putative radical SAM enzyme (TIGR03279 family)